MSIDSAKTSPRPSHKANTPDLAKFQTPSDGSFNDQAGQSGKDETQSVKERTPIRKDPKTATFAD